ncbi:MAG TPA: HD domain-containing phosphohydrolase [Miltoncostaeaceae bacterium]|nr:HD domain-containing phosphohydrolase [Miltoncostaeaceae bacterium]
MAGQETRVAAAEIPPRVDLARIDPEAREVIETCLGLARERLGMEIAWLGEFHDGREVLRVVEGDRDEWRLWDDHWLPAAGSFCERMLDGRIGNAVPDAAREPEVAELEVTRGLRIGAYVGVPLVLRSGELRGAFCCARHTPAGHIGEREVRVMQVLARLVADQLAYREEVAARRRAEAQAAGAHALAAALDARDGYTADHSRAVVQLAVAVARRLGLADDDVDLVAQVALLHDIGKVGIPDALLHKPAALTPEEAEVMRRHPAIGAGMVARVSALAHLAPAILAEHEHWDGGGYPEGIAGDEIPLASRITLACDGYHAMVSDRPYRPAMPRGAVLAELRRCAGTMFWPRAVDALVAELEADGTAPP